MLSGGSGAQARRFPSSQATTSRGTLLLLLLFVAKAKADVVANSTGATPSVFVVTPGNAAQRLTRPTVRSRGLGGGGDVAALDDGGRGGG